MKLFSKCGACLLLYILLLSQKTWSQHSFNIGATLNAGGNGFPEEAKRGLGASLGYTRAISKTGDIRLYLAYDWFNQRFPGVTWQVIQDSIDVGGFNRYDMSLVPIRAGYQHFLIQDAFFVYAEAGLSHLITKYEYPSISRNCFSYAIGTGYNFELDKTHYLQVSGYYNHNRLNWYIKRNYISIRVALGLSKH